MLETMLLYVWYRVVMWMLKASIGWKRRNEWYFLGLGYLVAGIGYVADVLYNLIIGTIIFVDLPREWTLSERMARYRRDALRHDFRAETAKFVCERLLNPYDPTGHHC